jgi:hypothetical protein
MDFHARQRSSSLVDNHETTGSGMLRNSQRCKSSVSVGEIDPQLPLFDSNCHFFGVHFHF